ncbi:Methionyl-tRNA formyltransferase [Anopheles sinensis]|uniref:Methionyl-tRNA formyltransferase n=1 Tax=Anopheles sinensis TaxID=74873 RepID=A0A084W5V2_ANOSI|nr:Methionyl-tRNA formyltransferase [Anopheles sinensis]
MNHPGSSTCVPMKDAKVAEVARVCRTTTMKAQLIDILAAVCGHTVTLPASVEYRRLYSQEFVPEDTKLTDALDDCTEDDFI